MAIEHGLTFLRRRTPFFARLAEVRSENPLAS
jgi:hypothetical protein